VCVILARKFVAEGVPLPCAEASAGASSGTVSVHTTSLASSHGEIGTLVLTEVTLFGDRQAEVEIQLQNPAGQLLNLT
jgi:hypothetical protein